MAKFREAQKNIREQVENTEMVVTMDVGEKDNHHPRYKKQVGERLAFLALNKTYSKSVQAEGPQSSSFTQNGNTATINFINNSSNGLSTIENLPINQFFFVAGADKVFLNTNAIINRNIIVLTATTNTPLPIIAIRYAFTNYPIKNLQNDNGLPIEPFRTDDLDN